LLIILAVVVVGAAGPGLIFAGVGLLHRQWTVRIYLVNGRKVTECEVELLIYPLTQLRSPNKRAPGVTPAPSHG
jgi:hypothetical protein